MNITFDKPSTPIVTFDELDLTDRYNLLDSLPKEYAAGVEIGVWQGWYTAQLVERTSMHIVGIDPWVATESYEDSDPQNPDFNPTEHGADGFLWQETRYISSINLLGQLNIPQRWELLRGFSYNLKHFFGESSLDFVYIDGEHSYEAVSKDIGDWWPRVKRGGILAGHDYNDTNPGSIRAVDEFAEKAGVKFKITGTSPEKGDADAPSWIFIKE
jgi:hypothetical protein